jgi:hypothetical protein
MPCSLGHPCVKRWPGRCSMPISPNIEGAFNQVVIANLGPTLIERDVVEARLFWVGDRFLACDAKGVFFSLNFQVAHAWQFDNRDEIVPLLENIDRRKWAHASRRVPEPVTRPARFKSPLKSEEQTDR